MAIYSFPPRVPDQIVMNRDNYFGYIDSSDPDAFGILRFLTDELQDAEDAGDRGQFPVLRKRMHSHSSTSYPSVDHWPCVVRVGWISITNESYQSL